ncbi:CoA transferase subunit A [Actinomadura mexicana]|uniref:Glutaconate CoA-transferase subunit A n=1 Tax=Actinomadura mexicana TaxID=134959 RepID=A0A239C2U5_9ACTN|nr:CoA-transferase [Actinomadura mexicana]SNS13734.1 glutaconate CoA-transferase subunit A [Actinomadura mexicana]
MIEKLTSAEQAMRLVRDGDVVGLQSGPTQCAPMTLVRELIRRGTRDLHIVSLSGGIALDWLVAAGGVGRVTFAAATMEHFGMCRRFRRAVEAGAVGVEELSETAFLARLGAAARGLPFLPTAGMIGTDLLSVGNPAVKVVLDPFGGPPVVACAALHPDVALLHAHRADRFGNVAVDPGPRHPMTALLPRAARRVVVTVEEIVDTDVLRRAPERTVLPAFLVDAVVEAPYGAHPNSLFPVYDYDAEFIRSWVAAAGDEAGAARFLDRVVHGAATHGDYVTLIGLERLAGLTPGGAR